MTTWTACRCSTLVAHDGPCQREATGVLCQYCSDGHNEKENVLKFRVEKDTPVALIVEADDRVGALAIAEDKWDVVWKRLDEVAAKLQEELGVEVVIGYPYDVVTVSEDGDMETASEASSDELNDAYAIAHESAT